MFRNRSENAKFIEQTSTSKQTLTRNKFGQKIDS